MLIHVILSWADFKGKRMHKTNGKTKLHAMSEGASPTAEDGK
jgi:hypothetical protein